MTTYLSSTTFQRGLDAQHPVPLMSSFKRIDQIPGTVDSFKDMFTRTLEPIYGSQEEAIKKILKGEDRRCRVLVQNETPVGILVYKKILSNEFKSYGIVNSLQVKSLFLVDAKKNSGKGYGTVILNHVIEVAKRIHASSIHLTASESSRDSCAFFVKKQFRLVHTYDDLYKPGIKEHLFCLNLDGEAEFQSGKKRKERTEPLPDPAETQYSSAPFKKILCKRKFEKLRSPLTSSTQKPSKYRNDSDARHEQNERRETSATGEYGRTTSSHSERHGNIGRRTAAPYRKRAKSEAVMQNVPIKSKYLQMIRTGSKTVEGRIDSGMFRKLAVGGKVRFFSGQEQVYCVVEGLDHYSSFEEMLTSVGYQQALPDAKDLQSAVKVYNSIPSFRERSERSGVLAIHIKKINI